MPKQFSFFSFHVGQQWQQWQQWHDLGLVSELRLSAPCVRICFTLSSTLSILCPFWAILILMASLKRIKQANTETSEPEVRK